MISCSTRSWRVFVRFRRALEMFDPLPQRQRIRQRTALFKRVLRMNVGIGRCRHPGQRGERQSIADRRIARHEEELAAPQTPFLADPAQAARHARGRVPALHRQYESGRLGQPARKGADHAIALFGILDLRIERIDIVRQIAFLDEPAGRILEGRHDAIIFDAEELRDAARQRLRLAALLLGEDDGRRPGARSSSVSTVRPTASTRSGSRQIGWPSLRQ